jgi:hypothetical protein
MSGLSLSGWMPLGMNRRLSGTRPIRSQRFIIPDIAVLLRGINDVVAGFNFMREPKELSASHREVALLAVRVALLYAGLERFTVWGEF